MRGIEFSKQGLSGALLKPYQARFEINFHLDVHFANAHKTNAKFCVIALKNAEFYKKRIKFQGK
ncbi:hypothetical protein CGRAC_0276 [Campylobacter gracilis]|uniref:Uncharacterized protein n=1 Tax=Campylobacter gracilis RM3268 TaxID=553220 RepID=C8PF86_9BACT|nr:hypothetical protein CGRAC_0276 [Campylobacter gracilis]EEV18714.1 hypothetical protein CAMGR0001_2727 [Campylobacter gracilis RM3268]